MNGLTNFTVLIERQALKQAATWLLMLTMVFSLLVGQHAFAAPPHQRAKKVALDLDVAIEAGVTPTNKRWAREVRGQRMVQVVFVSGDADQNMSDLRNEIKRAGGTIDASMPGLRMLTATLPAKKVKKVAERSDVHGLVQGRATRLLHDGGAWNRAQVGNRVSRALSVGTTSATSAPWSSIAPTATRSAKA